MSRISWHYDRLRGAFLPLSVRFLGVLTQAVGEDYLIFGKVRVADILTPKKGISRSEWQKAFNRISAKHFDVVLCLKTDLSIKFVIELDDSSHNSSARKKRDAFLVRACAAANLSLVQASAKRAYSILEIKEFIICASEPKLDISRLRK